MCEVLVRVVDKVNPNDANLDAQCLKRGDFVSICPDGWGWSQIERTNPDWRIVKISGLSVEEAKAYLAKGAKYRRAFKLDVDDVTLPQGVKNYVQDSARTADSITVTRAQIVNFIKARSQA